MALPNYGLLTGSLIDHGPQAGGNPHYVLLVKAGFIEYRVALNLQPTISQGDSPSGLEYQITDDISGTGLANSIKNKKAFILHDQFPSTPSLDFVRDGVVNLANFKSLKAGVRPTSNPLYQALLQAAAAAIKSGAFVAVFGTGYPDQDDHSAGLVSNPRRSSSGFTGLDNVHMNQGNFLRVDTHMSRRFRENGTHQDGGVLFFLPSGKVTAFFIKFADQDIQTDDFGNPVHTGVAELDSSKSIKPSVRKKLIAKSPKLLSLQKELLAKTAQQKPEIKTLGAVGSQSQLASGAEIPVSGSSGGNPANGFVFNDSGSLEDPNRPFDTDDDSQYRNSPFVKNFAANGVPEPVPGPRGGVYPTMSLQDVLGKAAIAKIQKNNKIVIHVAGDTGAPEAGKLGNEVSVADLMIGDFDPSIDPADQPSFYFHVGDVVYYYGEEHYYYSQFYKPYKDYPAPILAIPGNHDGITYLQEMPSLAGFINAFCDDQPRHWAAAGGIGRTTMTQPGVYFTLDCPFISIIGLYSNCSESYGYLDDQQKLFLYNELVRLKTKRQNGEISAILLAVHHSPLSFSAKKPASSSLRDDIDKACDNAGIWPDAVLSGHAHIYQRMTRTVTVGRETWQVPHIISGSGGYDVNARGEVDKKDMALLDSSDPEFRLHNFYASYGYMRLVIEPRDGKNPPTIRFEFHSPSINDGKPADVCVLDLDKHVFV